MPRYLTPGKISLLVLLDVYLSGDIPPSARLDVLSLLSSHIISSSKHEHVYTDEQSQPLDLSIDAMHIELSKHESGTAGTTLYDTFLANVWQLRGIDSLFVFFKNVGNLYPGPKTHDSEIHGQSKLSRASPLGQFVRRCCYEFERLQFADVQKLYAAVLSYRASSFQRWATKQPDEARSWIALHGDATHAADNLQSSLESMSTQDIDSLLTSSIHILQKLGTRVPAAVKSKLQQWFAAQQDTSTQSLQHFMAFFEHWRAGQMSMAVEALHQYADYRGAENLRMYFQYAQLHQSVLYADFECWEESVNAMSECIATARENHDSSCLSFALSWLLHLRQAHPNNDSSSMETLAKLLGGGSEHDEITFLKTKARETKQWGLMSSTLLEEAKLELSAGGNTGKALEHILQSMFLNTQHDHRALMPAATLFESASFERLGQPRLSYRTCQTIMLLYRLYAPLNDRVRALCRLAHLSAQMGRYKSAEQFLQEAEGQVQGVLKLQDRVAVSLQLLLLRVSIHRNQPAEAKSALQAVRLNRAAWDIQFESKTLEIAYLMQTKDYERALSVVNAAIEKLKKRKRADIAQRLQLLVVKSKVFIAAGQAAKGFSIAMRAALTAERYFLMSVLTEAIVALASILNALGEFAASREMAEAALPHALSTNNVQLEAEMFSSLADSCAGLAGRESPGSMEQLSHLKLSLFFIERSRSAYHKLEDICGISACLLKKSVLERAMGDLKSAELTDHIYFKVLEGSGSVERAVELDEKKDV